MTEEQKRLSAEEWWADKDEPSRRQRKQLTPYQRQCLAIQLSGLRAERFAAKREPQE
jgi:hypothetical protein